MGSRLPSKYERCLMQVRNYYIDHSMKTPEWSKIDYDDYTTLIELQRKYSWICDDTNISKSELDYLSNIEIENPKEIPREIFERRIRIRSILKEMYIELTSQRNEYFLSECTLTKNGRKKMREYIDDLSNVWRCYQPSKLIEKLYTRELFMIDLFNMEYSDFVKKLMPKMLESKENVVFSPYSFLELMGIIAFATSEDSRNEILETIGWNIDAKELEVLLDYLKISFCGSTEVSIANAIIALPKIQEGIKSEFKTMFSNKFNGEIFSSDNLIATINTWVSKKTNGMIQKVFDQSIEGMILSMVNATAFDSEWLKAYEDAEILERSEFLNCDGSKAYVNMMSSSENDYVEDEFFSGFLKPYKNGYSFLALLPKDKNSTILQSGKITIDFFRLISEAKRTNVHVRIPEFKTEFENEISGILKEWGVLKLFSEEANFSALIDERLRVDRIIHKSVIEVNRKGTKAAAVTASCLTAGFPTWIPDRREVFLNRPFVYAIVNNDNKLPLFVGTINKL